MIYEVCEDHNNYLDDKYNKFEYFHLKWNGQYFVWKNGIHTNVNQEKIDIIPVVGYCYILERISNTNFKVIYCTTVKADLRDYKDKI